ncbi:hypothetical protein KQ306_04775 [Synechococcus sp. CS-1324]|uniref:hypothetical protein n=1 Tax=Synechococcus sp. CS-1324 TaxID=2847980 RepID=UPI000DB3D817|nr:hypothetical protein [Synechococcus sp. CS-1324]MCT0230174.1 hypothetical protein [Synechococcus sp. CS-1324]PZV05034.1 MAG: hypothetical protein DCF23_04285 [Cyanobium sp.]
MAELQPVIGPPDNKPYRIAPLIRTTLLLLYLSLVGPLPVLAPPELRVWLLAALMLGLVLVLAMLSEQVVLESDAIRVGHPRWCAWLFRRGWRLDWSEVGRLVPITTSQGGTVHYIRSRQGEHFLLPQRLERFADFLMRFQQSTGLDTRGIGRITPAWTYWTLAMLSLLLLIGEGISFAWLLPAQAG